MLYVYVFLSLTWLVYVEGFCCHPKYRRSSIRSASISPDFGGEPETEINVGSYYDILRAKAVPLRYEDNDPYYTRNEPQWYLDASTDTIMKRNAIGEVTKLQNTKGLVQEALQISSSHEEVRLNVVKDENEVLEGAELCINVFFGRPKNVFHGRLLRKLLKKHTMDLLDRFQCRQIDDTMIKAIDDNGEMIGYAETFVANVDADIYRSYLACPSRKPLVESNGRIYIPKIANLAIIETARKRGLGKRLVDACILQSKLWGFDQVILQVEANNKDARAFYKKLGFEEMFKDMSEVKYDTSGIFLNTVAAPMVILRKQV